MEIIRVKRTFKQPYAGGADFHTFMEKSRYVIARDLMAQLPRDNYEQTKVSELPKEYYGEDLNDKSLLILNLFALGDSLMFTPILKHLKTKYPKSYIIMETRPGYNLLEGNPYVDEFIYTPVPYTRFKEVDYYADCYEYVGSYFYNYMNLVDFWAAKLRQFDIKDKDPVVVPQPEAMEYMKPIIQKIRDENPGKKIMMAHMVASSIHRSLPPYLVAKVIDKMKDDYVFVTAHPKWEAPAVDISKELYMMDVENLSPYMEKPQYLVALIQEVDGVISADTVVPHIAAALKKPCVVISGGVAPEAQHFPKMSYTTSQPVYAKYLGNTCSAPCIMHAVAGPCQEAQIKQKFYSPCFDNIDIDEVVSKFNTIVHYIQNPDKDIPTECPVCKESNIYFEEVEKSWGYRLWECSVCGSIFSLPRKAQKTLDDILNKEQLKSFYDTKDIENLDSVDNKEKLGITNIFTIYTYPALRTLIDIEPSLKNKKMLDIGFNSGKLLAVANEILGLEIYGVERSKEQAEKVKKALGDMKLDIAKTLDHNYIKSLKDRWGTFSIVILENIIGGLEYPYEFFESVKDILEENGIAIFTFPNKDRPYIKVRKGLDWSIEDGDYQYTINRVSVRGLEIALRKAGFSYTYANATPLFPGDIVQIMGPPPVLTLNTGNNQQMNINPAGMETYIYNYMKPIFNAFGLHGQFGIVLASKKPINNYWFKRLDVLWELVQTNVMRREYIVNTYLDR
ncbi:methyltransferase domain-containing protein [Hydrogenobaculum acidophilum]